MGLMENVSRPLIGLLVATVAFFALWIVALKPSSSSSKSGGLGQYQPAINAARNVVKASGGAAAAQGSGLASAPATAAPAATATSATATATTASAAKTTAPAKTVAPTKTVAPARAPSTPTQRLNMVERALRRHHVVAILFFNPAAADDRAVKHELSTVPTHRGGVVKLTVPLNELARYTFVTAQVPVSSSPTLVLIDRAEQATMIVGFADRFEIAQDVADALAVKRAP
jgi:hypothetical protein